jgi:hypothetical protein
MDLIQKPSNPEYFIVVRAVLSRSCYASNINTVMYIPVARKWISKHNSLTIVAVFSVWVVQNGYKELFGCIEQSSRSEESNFGTPAWQDMSLEVNWVDSSELAAAE